VFGGRLAAASMFPPVGEGDVLDVYVRASEVEALLADWGAIANRVDPNVFVHVVDDEVWPFATAQSLVSQWVAWLDLADRDDRGLDVFEQWLATTGVMTPHDSDSSQAVGSR
jgi:hypothetical protein